MSWQQVKGHDNLIAGFAGALARGRLAHAYLFTGPPGVGKRLFAGQLAKTLLCEAPPPGKFDSCDTCPACILVTAGTHPDLFTVRRPDDKLEFPIEIVRQLCSDLAMKPARGGRKIAILDDADDLNEESANSFLKTLEEPPPLSLLVLIGSTVDRQLPTIRSRCQVMSFASLPEIQVRDVLVSGGIEPAQAARLAAISGGSPGLARELADPDLWEFRDRLGAGLAQTNPNSPALAREWVALAEAVGKDAGGQRRRAALVLRLLMDVLRSALARSLGQSIGAGESGEDKVLDGLARVFGPDALLKRLDRCLDADAQIERRVQLLLVLEGLVDALANG